MPIYKPYYVNDHYYHIFNRGVAKQNIFIDNIDKNRFLQIIAHYTEQHPPSKFSVIAKPEMDKIIWKTRKSPLVEIISYTLMPNHFHFLVKQLENSGVVTWVRRSINSYTRYYNTKHQRVGTLLQGVYRAIAIESDEQLLQLSRYIHLNSFTARLVYDPKSYHWSSYGLTINNKSNRLVNPKILIDLIGSIKNYSEFVEDYADYVRALEDNVHIYIDN